jgi:hypothetical protein
MTSHGRDSGGLATWAPPNPGSSDRHPKIAQHPPTPPALGRARRRNTVILVVACLLIGTVTAVGTGVALRNTSARGPTPEHPIAGKAIVLPVTLYIAHAPGSRFLITANDAQTVATVMWHLWENAMVHGDTRALTQLVANPLRTSEVYQCACALPRPVSPYAILTEVPLQQAYPLYFLSEIITQYNVASQSSPRYGMELQVITKASASAPWQLSLATGYDEVDGSQPPPLSMNSVPVAPAPPSRISYSYNPPPNTTSVLPASQYLPTLAAYWQSWKTAGRAPTNSLFVDDGGTSGFGAQIAESPQDQYDQYNFHVDPNDPQWVFSSAEGQPIVCGTVIDTSKNMANPGALIQNASRTNWGMQLPQGAYYSITSQFIHQTCVLPNGNKLDAYGTEGNFISIKGQLMQ